jgi:hypothetical protein
MPGRLSGIDAISPAIQRTKRQLFAPFRFKHWMRLAVVCILTGEITGGGGSGLGSGTNFNFPTHPGRGGMVYLKLAGLNLNLPLEFLAWALVIAVAAALLVLVFIYISSVFRFILFDAVLYNRCDLGEGWRRWQRQGSSYFLWKIGLGLISLAAFAVVIGVPVFAAWRAGWFSHPERHFGALIFGGLGVFGLFVAMIVLIAVVSLFTKDFVVPVMALEDQRVLEGWQRVLPMLGQEKGAYAFYVVMKILLAIGSAIIFGLLDFLVILALLIPLGLAGLVLFFVAKGAGMTWNPLTIGAVAAAGTAVVLLLILAVALVSTPAMIFFQAYSIHFFGSRHQTLANAIASTEPPPAAPPSPPVPVPVT